MEVKDENFVISVDSKKFVAHPEAKLTMEGAMAVLNYALQTGEHDKINMMLVQGLTLLMHNYTKEHKKKGWFNNDKPKWGE